MGGPFAEALRLCQNSVPKWMAICRYGWPRLAESSLWFQWGGGDGSAVPRRCSSCKG